MPIKALRAKQSTNTTGTGTLTLLAASSAARSFQAAFGASSIRVRYVISGASFFEIGLGTFNGAAPGTLTRDATPLASSNAGALVSLPAGTADVFAWIEEADRSLVESSAASVTLALADLGSVLVWTGAANGTVALPAVANVPPGAGYTVVNATTGFTLTIDPNGTETIEGATTLTLHPGGRVVFLRVASAWRVVTGAAVLPAPMPTASAVIGQWVDISVTDNTAVVLPAGGTWAYLVLHRLWSSNQLTGRTIGVAAGGTTLAVAVPGYDYIALAWRLA
jgi:hypothetical protein